MTILRPPSYAQQLPAISAGRNAERSRNPQHQGLDTASKPSLRKRPITHLVTRLIAVVRRGKDRDAQSTLLHGVTLLPNLVRSDNRGDPVVLAETLRDVWSEGQSDSLTVSPAIVCCLKPPPTRFEGLLPGCSCGSVQSISHMTPSCPGCLLYLSTLEISSNVTPSLETGGPPCTTM